MKQLVVLSGKGGTGKTVVTAAFTHLASRENGGRAVSVDADVDASNLELLVGRRRLEEHEFIGPSVAMVEREHCTGCGICREVCRFDAVRRADDGWSYRVDRHACEGCETCFHQCPEQAIRLVPQLAGHWYRSESYRGMPFFHARMRPAQENSGKLVSLIKEQGRAAAVDGRYPLVIVDGPPGIACPAIAAASGADLALIVTEPTVAGLQDLERALAMASHFRLRSVVVVNKSDLHPAGARRIEEGGRQLGVDVLTAIPFDETVPRTMAEGGPVTELAPDSAASRGLIRLWRQVGAVLDDIEEASPPVREGAT